MNERLRKAIHENTQENFHYKSKKACHTVEK
jgi:hypothetical protein